MMGAAAAPAHAGAEPIQWRLFLRALVDEVDAMASPAERDEMLRGIGARMARLLPISAVGTLAMLQLEINEVLGSIGWGQASFELDRAEHLLAIDHVGLPRIGSAGDPPGTWLSALLEGLYESWFGQQQQAGTPLAFNARRIRTGRDGITLHYGRA